MKLLLWGDCYLGVLTKVRRIDASLGDAHACFQFSRPFLSANLCNLPFRQLGDLLSAIHISPLWAKEGGRARFYKHAVPTRLKNRRLNIYFHPEPVQSDFPKHST